MDDVIYLISTIVTKDSDGFDVISKSEKAIFAEKKDVGRTEFYKAQKAGMKVSAVFRINTDEYSDEVLVRFGDVEYNVVRSFEISEYYTELTCQKVE